MAFDILICIVPLLLILLTVIGIYLNSADVLNKVSGYLFQNLPFSPDYKEIFINEMINRTKELSSNTLLSGLIGGSALLWTVSSLFGTVRTILNLIYKIEESVNFFFGKLKDIILVIIIVLLFIISFTVTSAFELVSSFSVELFGIKWSFGTVESIVTILIAFMSTFTMFYILYAFVPHWKVSSKRVPFYSSILAAILFEMLKFLFTIYLLKLANFGKIYGTYASLAITFIWIYYISIVFVIGAEFGEIYREKESHKVLSKKKSEVKVKEYGTKEIIQNP
jgi:membrane protein